MVLVKFLETYKTKVDEKESKKIEKKLKQKEKEMKEKYENEIN